MTEGRRQTTHAAFYFGPIGGAGHFLWTPTGLRLTGWRGTEYGLPWESLDGPLLPTHDTRQGHGRMHREQGWTALSIHDYTVDSRPGSHATFFLHREVQSFAEAVGALCRWPWLASIFDRIGPWTDADEATDDASRPTSASPSGASPVAEAGRVSSPTWCDGTPHSPTAIPPLPLHDWRWMGDDPYTECARCGRITGHDGRVIAEGRATALASGGAE